MRSRSLNVVGLMGMAAVMLVASSALAAPRGRQAKPTAPKLDVELAASVEAVVPGQPFELAVTFNIGGGWHMYWENAGETGAPPHFTWSLPEGFEISRPTFPVPERHVDSVKPGEDVVTYVLEHSPVLLFTVTPPADIAGAQVDLSTSIRVLLCQSQCVWQEPKAKLTLPVATSGGSPKPAHVDLFAEARKAAPSDRSDHLTVAITASKPSLKSEEAFDVLVTVQINEGEAILADSVAPATGVGAMLLLGKHPDIDFQRPVYPAPVALDIPGKGAVDVFKGTATIRVPAETWEDIDNTAQAGLRGVLSFQVVDADGTLLPREALVFPSDAVKTVPVKPDSATPGSAPVKPEAQPVATTPPAETTDSPVAAAETKSADGLEGALRSLGLPGILLACFLYGLMINATPCVLPLLSVKVMGFVQQAHQSRSRTLALGLTFGLGVMIFWVVLGLLAAAGTNVLQYDVVVIALGGIVTAFALSMLGVFSLQAPTAATNLEANIQQETLAASFGKGALAPVLGLACTGPMMAGAFAWATTQSQTLAVLASLAAGLGMASPYMLLGANPNWLSFLPRPGNWMITFERIMGILLLAMALWLLDPIADKYTAKSFQGTMYFMIVIAFACWLVGRVDINMSTARRLRYQLGSVVAVIAGGFLIFGLLFPLEPVGKGAQSDHGLAWRKWNAEEVEQTVQSGKTVFLDVTANYCKVCKVNKARATARAEAKAKYDEYGIVLFKADYSDGDSDIFKLLKTYERLGPPLNLIYPAGKPDEPIVLEPDLSLGYLLEKLEEAGPSRASNKP